MAADFSLKNNGGQKDVEQNMKACKKIKLPTQNSVPAQQKYPQEMKILFSNKGKLIEFKISRLAVKELLMEILHAEGN